MALTIFKRVFIKINDSLDVRVLVFENACFKEEGGQFYLLTKNDDDYVYNDNIIFCISKDKVHGIVLETDLNDSEHSFFEDILTENKK